MRRFFVALLFAAGLLVGERSSAAAEPDLAEPATIEGKWKLVATTWYGKESKNEVGLVWEFQGKNRFTMNFAGGRTLEGRYWLDTTKKPWQVDIETTEDDPAVGGGGRRKGIVSLDGDRLQLCVSGSAGAPRPTKMVSKIGTLDILRSLKRLEQKQ